MTCDAAVVLLWRKFGEYAESEFQTAIHGVRSGGSTSVDCLRRHFGCRSVIRHSVLTHSREIRTCLILLRNDILLAPRKLWKGLQHDEDIRSIVERTEG